MAEKKTTESKKHAIPDEARQHYRTAREEMLKSLSYLVPEGFITHHRNARKEMLLAWRSMLDAAIQHMDEKEA